MEKIKIRAVDDIILEKDINEKFTRGINSLKNDIEKYIIDEDELNKYTEDLKKARTDLTNKEKLLDKLNIQQEIFKCPSCSIHLKFQDNDLHIYESGDINDELGDIDVVSDDISKLKRKISSLESSIPIKQNKLESFIHFEKFYQKKFQNPPLIQEDSTPL